MNWKRFVTANVKCVLLIIIVSCFTQCKHKKKEHGAVKKEIVKKPEEMDDQVANNIKEVLTYASDNNGKINDSIRLSLPDIVNSFYEKNDYKNVWSKKERWLPLADSMLAFIVSSKYYGLYPSDYHWKDLNILHKKLTTDPVTRTDAITWTKADLMLSDAFMKLAKDIKEGRLLPDSVSITQKPNYVDSFFIKNITDAFQKNSLYDIFNSMEPLINRYHLIKDLTKNFVDSMDTEVYQYIDYPQKDSMNLVKTLQKRLMQSFKLNYDNTVPDSITLNNEIKKYQAKAGLKKDGKISAKLINTLNNTDEEKFKRLAITLDRYKKFQDSMPVRYIWVNLPSFYLEVWDTDTLTILSKVVIGKPDTRTPALTSHITDMITFPQWTIPESIIKKEILPGLKKDPGYLAKKGFMLTDEKGNDVNPFSIKWAKYSQGIPYKVIQGSGDDNALGIFKFNFNNQYSVYLHDTNQRYLFKNTARALSHGCVRVQKWQELAYYIATNDSLNNTNDQKLSYNIDSINTWLANKVKKRMYVKNKLPLYIVYFTCDAKKGKLAFYDDIYNEDKMLAQKYFANKQL